MQRDFGTMTNKKRILMLNYEFPSLFCIFSIPSELLKCRSSSRFRILNIPSKLLKCKSSPLGGGAGKKENIYKLDNPENTSSLRTVTIFPGDRKVAG